MTGRYVVAFDRRFTVYDLATTSEVRAIENAGRIEHGRAPWTAGGHLAYVTDGDSLGRCELLVRVHDDGTADFEAEPDPGPIPVEIARRILDTWSDSP